MSKLFEGDCPAADQPVTEVKHNLINLLLHFHSFDGISTSVRMKKILLLNLSTSSQKSNHRGTE
ncbi:hypothetical protein, partial [Fischerella thermalis]|uniref:hypothetical protein n=1 Tax=Fischerella thermalis TaxID=372787 RepID=UPI001CA54B84